MSLPISGLIDLRDQLPTNDQGGPARRVALARKWGVVIHYNGPAVDRRRPILNIIRADAVFHVSRNWANPGDPPIQGDGLMYHVVVGHEGEKFLCRDLECVLWHCASWPHNETALAVHVPIGEDQRANPAQLQALAEICDEWLAAGHGSRAHVWGHRELSATDCPGTLTADFILPYRAARGRTTMLTALTITEPVSDVLWFEETGHGIGHGFKAFWCQRGGLPIFGYPLTDELEEDDPSSPTGKRVVQYFERAVFEFHPEAPEGWTVQLRHVGREALARKQAVPVG